MSKEFNVLSTFDGMSCGQLALNVAGVSYTNYYASEIDRYAKQVTQSNYPDTIQLGDVTTITADQLPHINLLIGGSPCQNLSIATINNIKHNKGLQGEKSKLFYEYLRLLHQLEPQYFLFENVASMTNANKDLITQALGVEPIKINSNRTTAQDRERYYWSNIPTLTQPADRNIILSDIIEPNPPAKYWYTQTHTYNGDNEKIQATLDINGHDILKRVYNLNGKCGTLTCVSGGNTQKKVYQNGKCRKLTPLEYERLQNVPDNYTSGVSDSQRYNMLGNGWTIGVIAHFFKNLNENTSRKVN
ncbi:DNA cytosine methyltransferase [Flavobacterium sp. MC2016-06]|jgi:site-specific DNA-cytosine methylase|uniref:DNA cytosine methyltransferase n=1 Tax=Flavobacterium sp. MC2016-06 TaxID=2676308 RepID=UPI0012BA59ED|nr:DNA cytosine methyltransferase [Flavobacterium sp. MC2016-06]MBU3861014.1 DNA cytosine methyltransferase [Flavobacterium sp. MC2016-06]